MVDIGFFFFRLRYDMRISNAASETYGFLVLVLLVEAQSRFILFFFFRGMGSWKEIDFCFEIISRNGQSVASFFWLFMEAVSMRSCGVFNI